MIDECIGLCLENPLEPFRYADFSLLISVGVAAA
jgi:hypothetical protein